MSSIIYNGHEIQDLIVNGNQAQLWLNGQKLYPTEEPVDPYNPLGLPPFTIRCKFSSGYTPTMGDSQTLVDASENVWDITKNDTNWKDLLYSSNLLSVLGANSTGVTNMQSLLQSNPNLTQVELFDTSSCTNMGGFISSSSITSVPLFDTSSCTNMSNMFSGCRSLTSVPLFDTSSCKYMNSMFYECRSLTSVPLFDTSSCTNMEGTFEICTSLTTIPLFDTSSCISLTRLCNTAGYDSNLTSIPLLNTSSATDVSYMFNGNGNVQSGSLELYQQMSTQATPPSNHSGCFTNCGYNTQTGAAELAQIPTSWGGTMAE